ncbi:hypothetical protein ACHQM5_030684 [Ranunculus cassubicifolius]
MRTGHSFNPPPSVAVVSASSSPLIEFQQQASPWHSPMPYLFGGLAAMLGLIAFALMILACSYWKLYTALERRTQDTENGKDSIKVISQVFEENIVVIMAGDDKPSYLATPCSSSFVNNEGTPSKDEA